MTTLPPSVLSKVGDLGSVEDFLLPLLRQELDPIPVWSLLPLHFPSQGILVRKVLGPGTNRTDPRGFFEDVYVEIDCFTQDPDGDSDGEKLAKAIMVVIIEAWENGTEINGCWISKYRMPAEPARKPDFVDSSGPVQYADLPAGWWRYQTRFNLLVRHRPSSN